MAEQSIGMTTGSGDGVAGGYTSGRMTAMEQKTLSNGVLMYTTNGSDQPFALSGTLTSTLTIGEGAALVSGFFYENTSSLTISMTGLSNTTYYLVVVVNNAASTLSVARAAPNVTSLAAYTVRLALVTSVPSSAIQLATVAFNGASITAITYTYGAYDVATSLSRQVYASMSGGSATLTTANTTYDVTAYTSGLNTTSAMDNVFSLNATTGEITVRLAGLYLVTLYGVFSSGTTGNRLLGIQVNGSFVNSTRAASSGTSTHPMTQTAVISLSANDVVKSATISTIATQNFGFATLTIARV